MAYVLGFNINEKTPVFILSEFRKQGKEDSPYGTNETSSLQVICLKKGGTVRTAASHKSLI